MNPVASLGLCCLWCCGSLSTVCCTKSTEASNGNETGEGTPMLETDALFIGASYSPSCESQRQQGVCTGTMLPPQDPPSSPQPLPAHFSRCPPRVTLPLWTLRMSEIGGLATRRRHRSGPSDHQLVPGRYITLCFLEAICWA